MPKVSIRRVAAVLLFCMAVAVCEAAAGLQPGAHLLIANAIVGCLFALLVFSW